MTFTFDNNNTFRNVGIHNGNNELIVMNINASSDNISLHSSSNSSNVDTLSIKNILHKDTTKDLNICAYNNNINPIIQINNTHQHVNITSNLNVASNLNVTGATTLSDTLNVKDVGTDTDLLTITTTNTIISNILKADGNIEVKKDIDTRSYFGKAVIGWMDHSNHAGFCHIDNISTTSYALIQNSDGTTSLNSKSGKSIRFNIGDNPRMTLLDSGNLGIATTAPTEKLHVNGNIKLTGDLDVGSSTFDITGMSPATIISTYVRLKDRGLVLYQSSFGASGNTASHTTWGQASWVMRPRQNFKLEFLVSGSNGQPSSVCYINGNGVYHDASWSFTGQHRNKTNDNKIYNNIEDYIGHICYSIGKFSTYDFNKKKCNTNYEAITINDTIPIIDITTTRKDKRIFGVISDKEEEDRILRNGAFISQLSNDNDDKRVYVNSIGEGAIWIVNTNGNLENGDYIQSSQVAGHGEKQDSEFLANYTVAKITCDCDFTLNSEDYNCIEFIDSTSGNTYRKAFVGCTYHCG